MVKVENAGKFNGDIMAKTALKLIRTTQDNASVAGNEPASLDFGVIGHEFHYWEGLSGTRYLHSVYPLQLCPELPKANFIIVRKGVNGACVPLAIGQTHDDAMSLNLAHIRHTAAQLGGNEIHIHVMTNSAKERENVELDLRLGQFRQLENRLRAEAANSPA